MGELSDRVLGAELEASGRFRTVTGALDEPTRRLLLERIGRRIEDRPGATLRKTYLDLLHVAELL